MTTHYETELHRARRKQDPVLGWDEEQEKEWDEEQKIIFHIRQLNVGVQWMHALCTDPEQIREMMCDLYKRMLARAKHEGDLSFTRRLLHKWHIMYPQWPDPRPLFREEIKPDWYKDAEDERVVCCLELPI